MRKLKYPSICSTMCLRIARAYEATSFSLLSLKTHNHRRATYFEAHYTHPVTHKINQLKKDNNCVYLLHISCQLETSFLVPQFAFLSPFSNNTFAFSHIKISSNIFSPHFRCSRSCAWLLVRGKTFSTKPNKKKREMKDKVPVPAFHPGGSWWR
jgi:hypothetical protein